MHNKIKLFTHKKNKVQSRSVKFKVKFSSVHSNIILDDCIAGAGHHCWCIGGEETWDIEIRAWRASPGIRIQQAIPESVLLVLDSVAPCTQTFLAWLSQPATTFDCIHVLETCLYSPRSGR